MLLVFTFIFNKKLFINQIKATNIIGAQKIWIKEIFKSLKKDKIMKGNITTFTNHVFEDNYFEINDCSNVWCFSPIFNRKLMTINIVKTEEKNQNQINLYTFICEYNGGTYISQIKSNAIEKTTKIWKKNFIKDMKELNIVINKDELDYKLNKYLPYKPINSQKIWVYKFMNRKRLMIITIVQTEIPCNKHNTP